MARTSSKFSVKESLDKYIAAVTENREFDGMYHPSSMWACTRQVIYNVRGTDAGDGPDAQSQRRFYIGHRLHEAVQRALEADPDIDFFYPEFKIDDAQMNVTGHGDALCKIGKYWWIVEIKSIRRYAMRDLPKEHHVGQAKTYLYFARRRGITATTFEGEMVDIAPQGDKLKGIIMVYLEKEDLDIKEFRLEWEPSWDKEVENRIGELDSYRLDPASLPPRLPLVNGKKDWQCRYCPYATQCWKKDPDEIEPQELMQ